MKVTSVNPGVIKWSEDGTKFAYTIRYYDARGKTSEAASLFDYTSANAAKQAMREKLQHERRRHGL